jgi:hypothetical protein
LGNHITSGTEVLGIPTFGSFAAEIRRNRRSFHTLPHSDRFVASSAAKDFSAYWGRWRKSVDSRHGRRLKGFSARTSPNGA